MAKIVDARSRALSYMRDQSVPLILLNANTGWTDDTYRWPVHANTVSSLLKRGFIATRPDGDPNTYWITEAGLNFLAPKDVT